MFVDRSASWWEILSLGRFRGRKTRRRRVWTNVLSVESLAKGAKEPWERRSDVEKQATLEEDEGLRGSRDQPPHGPLR